VREGEFLTAQNAAGVPDQVRNLYNRVLSGERLNPTQRALFRGQAEALYGKIKGEHDAVTRTYRGIAKQYGFDPDRILLDYGPEPQNQPPTNPALTSPLKNTQITTQEEYNRLPSGASFFMNGQEYKKP